MFGCSQLLVIEINRIQSLCSTVSHVEICGSKAAEKTLWKEVFLIFCEEKY
jgi:hypothetical protein